MLMRTPPRLSSALEHTRPYPLAMPQAARSTGRRRAARVMALLTGVLLAGMLLLACTDSTPAAPPAASEPATPTARAAAPAPAPSTATPEASGPGVAWAAVVHQRHDVLELTLDDIRRILTGAVEDWAALGGAAAPVLAYLDERDVDDVAQALGIDRSAIQATLGDEDAVAAAVSQQPGAFALVRPEALRLGLLALVVDGHDPYSQPASASPLRTAGDVPDFAPVLIASPGELLPVRCTNAALEEHGDFNVIFEDIRPLLDRAHYRVIQLDPALTDLSPPTPCVRTFTLQGSTRAIPAMAEAGIDLVFATGNHITDCWEPCGRYDAMLDTLANLEAAGIATVGAGLDIEVARRPHVATLGTGDDRVTFAFLAYDEIAPWNFATVTLPGTAPIDVTVVSEDVARARELADVVIVGMSWGIEYTPDPTPGQRAAARAAVEAGAALVIGNHPHVVQAVEVIGGALVTYALGNFLFDQDQTIERMQSVYLEASFARGQLIGFRLRPVRLQGDPTLWRGLFRPRLVDPASEDGRATLGRIWTATAALP